MQYDHHNGPASRHPAGDSRTPHLRVDFDRRLKLEFHGSKVTSDAGFLAYRELDHALGLTEVAGGLFQDSRTGKNGRSKPNHTRLQGGPSGPLFFWAKGQHCAGLKVTLPNHLKIEFECRVRNSDIDQAFIVTGQNVAIT